jgi:hypothetical protein
MILAPSKTGSVPVNFKGARIELFFEEKIIDPGPFISSIPI